MLSVRVAAELADLAPGENHPSPPDLVDLGRWLDDELTERLRGWQRPAGLLGITKGRIRAASGCPASVVAETAIRRVDHAMALGTIVDTAACLLLMSDKVPGRAPWLGALETVLSTTSPDIAHHIAELTTEERDEFRTLVSDRCTMLGELLGDLRQCEGTAQERFRVERLAPGVVLSGRTDLVLGRRFRSIVEVKSGNSHTAQIDELGFYALLASLRDRRAPSAVAVVALGSQRLDAYPVTFDLLEAAGLRVLAAASELAAIDIAVGEGRWPRTEPGPFCSWCAAAPRCPDVPDVALAEQELRFSGARGFDASVREDGSGDDVDAPDSDDADEPW